MNPVELRKLLLIAESELNRAYLIGDIAALKAGVRSATDHAAAYGLIGASAAVLITGLAAVQRGKAADARARALSIQTLLEGAGLLSTLWLAFRWQGYNRKGRLTHSGAALRHAPGNRGLIGANMG